MDSLNRRGLLTFGLGASAVLATAGLASSLGGCSPARPASGFAVLRDSDLPLLRAVLPVLLAGSVSAGGLPSAVDGTLQSLDDSLAHLSAPMLTLTLQLFDILSLPVTRGPLTGVWGSWQQASSEQVEHFLRRWQNSSLNLLRQGHASLLQLVLMAWYGRPQAWAHCGYPGPPTV
ncbi:hypothetical protein PMM47T1_00760 [Pseudomonas sp. M47T1]|uniref:hypothetical protein n=1 Tax=unclassified Pseudomonas TaxID=196821 RepID=UPI00026077DF|nr:hypothetical protein [Pseudomonas sp. M47T1]EIK98524.1 hypothetical protein PMM47T1_00760 [Pseudomonas sp. M47T1]